MANNRRPRMAEVALAAGVGTITVSRALRTPDRVSSDVRARVQAAVEATGYVPNLAAGTLKSHRSNIVAAIVPTLRNTIFAATAEGLAEGLRSHGFQLMLASSGYSLQAEEEILLKLLGQQPAAVVLTGIRHTPRVRDLLRDRRLPVVETWDLTSRPIDRVVGFSNREAARSMTLALAARGYQRIAFAGTPPRQEWRATQRLAGYRQAWKTWPLASRPEHSPSRRCWVTHSGPMRSFSSMMSWRSAPLRHANDSGFACPVNSPLPVSGTLTWPSLPTHLCRRFEFLANESVVPLPR
jgi:LacI family gluconate utilization system Gnt-I transcriptional repressor